LHSAGQNTFLNVVQMIFNAYPEAISKRDSEGGVPLHHACCFNSNLQVVKFMYDEYPDGISLAQVDGIMPIHLAASQNPSADVMRFILSNCPESAFAVDNHGWLPLHCLIDNDPLDMTASRIESLRMLLRAHPQAVLHKNREGRSALDCARLKHHCDYVIRLMLLACPEADPVELARLNWNSQRRLAIMSCVSLSTTVQNDALLVQNTDSSRPRDNNNSSIGRDEDVDAVATVDDYRDNRALRMLTLLCRDGLSESGYQIENCVLRHVIKFL
jgi:hypothetical protein